jgi:hypothetical protein
MVFGAACAFSLSRALTHLLTTSLTYSLPLSLSGVACICSPGGRLSCLLASVLCSRPADSSALSDTHCPVSASVQESKETALCEARGTQASTASLLAQTHAQLTALAAERDAAVARGQAAQAELQAAHAELDSLRGQAAQVTLLRGEARGGPSRRVCGPQGEETGKALVEARKALACLHEQYGQTAGMDRSRGQTD